MTGSLPSTSAAHTLIIPALTFSRVFIAETSSNIGECHRRDAAFIDGIDKLDTSKVHIVVRKLVNNLVIVDRFWPELLVSSLLSISKQEWQKG